MDDTSLTAPAARPSTEARSSAPAAQIAHRRAWVVARWLVVAVVGVGGVLLRRSLMEEPITGVTNADEATTGIMALTILRGNVPLMLPGQAYSGTLEAYALAPFYALFGTSNLALKLVNVFLWGVAAVVCYFLARLVLTRLGATAAALLVWVPGLALILLSTRAYPGYATGLLAYLAALYCLGRVAEADQPTVLGSLIAGFLSGLAIWLHPMFACLVAPAIVVVTWRHRHALLRWLGPALVGVVVGMAPFLGYNLTNGWASLHQPPSAVGDVSYVDRLQAFVVQLWPRALGLRGISAVGPWSFTGAKYVYIIAIVAAFAGLVLLWRRGWAGKMLAVSALASPFLLALLDALTYYVDGRYGINFIAFFAIGMCALVEDLARRVPNVRRAVLLVLPLAWLLLVARPSIFNAVPHSPGSPDHELDAVIGRLKAAGIDRVRTTYFIAQPIVLDSDERILAAVTAGPTRFPYLQEAVNATDPHQVAYIFAAGEPVAFDSYALPVESYDRAEVGPYVLYLPRPSA